MIEDILQKYSIPQRGLFFAHRANLGASPTDRNVTMVLLSVYEHDCQGQWIEAVKEICMALAKAGDSHRIELIDERAFSGSLATSPILSTDRAIVEGWAKVLPDFLATIENQEWVALDVLNRQFPSREMQATVIISAQDANDDTWYRKTIPALSQLLQVNDLKLEVTLLFLNGKDLTMTGSSTLEGCFQPDRAVRDGFYMNPIPIGTSCAVSGSAGSGTLGCRMKLRKESSTLEFGLTNYHVLRGALGATGPVCGPFRPDLVQSYGIAVSPSDHDHEATVQGMKEICNEINETHKYLSQKLEYLTENDPARPSVSKNEKLTFDKRKILEDELEVAENSARYIGRVYAASGFRTCENPRFPQLMESSDWALNWCLAQVDQPKSISPQLQHVPKLAKHVKSGDQVTQYCSISSQENYDIVKRGRTTGWTRGTTSAVPSILRISDSPLPLPALPTIQKVEFEEKWGGNPVFVQTIVGTKEVPQFIEPGDSGSVALLDQASNVSGVSAVGLCFAANAGSYASYMIPMDLVVKDIEEVTGAKVVEPRNAGEIQ